ncbi:MAG: PepSY domain-containing protein [Rhodospirillaceae bacterium]
MTDITSDGSATTATEAPTRRKPRTGFMYWVKVTHRWIGLATFVWIAVLGFTGVVLDHPEWRWARQVTVTERFASDHLMQDQVIGNIARYFQVNPENADHMITGSGRGLWRTTNGGKNWTPVEFADYRGTPMVEAIIPAPSDPWNTLWLGTDDGLWLVSGAGGNATQVALSGEHITSLDLDARPGHLVGIVEKTTLFVINPDEPENVQWTRPGDVNIPNLPDKVGMARLMIDLHLGEGFTGGRTSMWWSDYGGVVMIILAITGLLYWLFPKRWKNRERRQKVRKTVRVQSMKWLYNLHSPVLGVIAVVPIIYLSISGIYIDHAEWFVTNTKDVTMDRDFMPSMYNMTDLTWQLDSLAASPTDPGHLTVMTRMGLIQTKDGGHTWAFDETTPLEAYKKNLIPGHVHRSGVEFVGVHGGPNYIREDGTDTWETIPSLRMMVMDGTKIGDTWILKGSRGFSSWKPGESAQKLDIAYPPLTGVPFERFMADLHAGMVFSHHFVWINDAVCILAIYLCMTGLIAWWKKKWA